MTVRRFLPWLLLTSACGSATGRGAPVSPVSGAETLNAVQLDSLWAHAQEAYHAGQWNKTIERVERFNLESPRNDPRRVEGHFLLGEAHLASGDRLEAAREFRKVSDETPTNKLAPDALLRVGDAYAQLWRRPELDATYGQTALGTYQELLNRYPDSDAATKAKARIAKLNDDFALKEYKAARYYLRMKAWDSAVIYLRDLLATYPQAQVAPQALMDLITTQRTLGYVEDAEQTCGYLRRFHPGTPGIDHVCPPKISQGP
jgi:outer membrane protein assembly factor BamD